MAKIIIYVDGACEPNPGTGAWAALAFRNTPEGKVRIRKMSGVQENSTNNRMEVYAVLQVLTSLRKAHDVVIVSDSRYVVNSIGQWVEGVQIKGWLKKWVRTGWKRGKVKNVDLWTQVIKELRRQRSIDTAWVRGHSGNVNNERCDALARKAMDGYYAKRYESLVT